MELMKILIANSSKEGDTVLDPFLGVGASGVAAVALKREFIGTEIDEQYFNIAKARIAEQRNKVDVEQDEIEEQGQEDVNVDEDEIDTEEEELWILTPDDLGGGTLV